MSIRGPYTSVYPDLHNRNVGVSLSFCCLVFSGWFIFSVCTLFQAHNDSAYAPVRRRLQHSLGRRHSAPFMNSLIFTFHLLLLACSTYGFEKRQDSSSNITSKAGVAWPNGATVSLKQFEGTGNWFLNTDKFRSWEEGKSKASLLWCYGTGK